MRRDRKEGWVIRTARAALVAVGCLMSGAVLAAALKELFK